MSDSFSGSAVVLKEEILIMLEICELWFENLVQRCLGVFVVVIVACCSSLPFKPRLIWLT